MQQKPYIDFKNAAYQPLVNTSNSNIQNFEMANDEKTKKTQISTTGKVLVWFHLRKTLFHTHEFVFRTIYRFDGVFFRV